MPTTSRDLFDDSTMSFGEHLEILRVHLFKAIIGIVLCVCVTLYYGDEVIAIIQEPINEALAEYGHDITVEDDLKEDIDYWDWFVKQLGFRDRPAETEAEAAVVDEVAAPPDDEITVQLDGYALASQLHEAAPETYAAPPESLRDKMLAVAIRSPFFIGWNSAVEQLQKPVTLNVQEAFMTYLKVSMISGLVISSPWVFYQIWQFVAAGLYRHERKFVYAYGMLSLFLFLVGVVFCFKAVFPFVLDFLLSFNVMMELTPQIRLSEWVSFAVMLPLMFGISFQLPLVMRFLQAISIFSVNTYQEKRRMAILVIAALSMFLTPADPMSMLLMMFPLIFLYEMGIVLCKFSPAQNPFDAEPI